MENVIIPADNASAVINITEKHANYYAARAKLDRGRVAVAMVNATGNEVCARATKDGFKDCVKIVIGAGVQVVAVEMVLV